LQTKAVFKWT